MVGFGNTRGVCSLEGEKDKQEGSSNMIGFTVGVRTEGYGSTRRCSRPLREGSEWASGGKDLLSKAEGVMRGETGEVSSARSVGFRPIL